MLAEDLKAAQDGAAFVVNSIEDYENNLTSYVIVEAKSHKKASEIFRNHPHFNIFPVTLLKLQNVWKFLGVKNWNCFYE